MTPPSREPSPTRLCTALLLLALTAPTGLFAQAGPPATRDAHFPADDDLAAMLRYLVEDEETVGIALGILEPDGTRRLFAHGAAGPGGGTVEPTSTFEIGSVTKVFTTTLLAEMVGRAEVALEDEVSAYLPPSVSVPTWEGRPIKLLDLATHTSGLPREPENNLTYIQWTVDSLYHWLGGHELRRAPGAEYEYSNLGMGLLGHVLARAAGVPLDVLMNDRLLKPLGMSSTSLAIDGSSDDRLVDGHDHGAPTPEYSFSEATAAAGALRSNVTDLLSFMAANVGPAGTDLERAMRLTHVPRASTEADGVQVGLAWTTATVRGRSILRHTGATNGFSSEMILDPESGVGVVLLSNSREFGDPLVADLMNGGFSMDEPEVERPLDELTSFLGTYTSSTGAPFYIGIDSAGYLTGQVPGRTRFRIHAQNDSEFFARRVPFTFSFEFDDAETPGSFVLGVGPRTNRFVRTEPESPPSAEVAENRIREVGPDEIATYAGTFALRSGDMVVELRVYGDGSRLMGDLGGRITRRLIPEGEHAFSAGAGGGLRVVFAVEDGRAVRVTVTQPNATLVGERIR